MHEVILLLFPVLTRNMCPVPFASWQLQREPSRHQSLTCMIRLSRINLKFLPYISRTTEMILGRCPYIMQCCTKERQHYRALDNIHIPRTVVNDSNVDETCVRFDLWMSYGRFAVLQEPIESLCTGASAPDHMFNCTQCERAKLL